MEVIGSFGENRKARKQAETMEEQGQYNEKNKGTILICNLRACGRRQAGGFVRAEFAAAA
jgi:hypothetical protein